MNFDIVSNRYCNLEGRTVLKVNIMRPIETVTLSEKYINDFANTCEKFVRNKLFPVIFSRANESKLANKVYTYTLKVKELYNSELKSSYAIYSVLECRGKIVASGLKAITFEGDKIVPMKLLNRQLRNKKPILAIGPNGKLTSLSLLNGILKTEDPC